MPKPIPGTGPYASGPELAAAIKVAGDLVANLGNPHAFGTKPVDGAQAALFVGEMAAIILRASVLPKEAAIQAQLAANQKLHPPKESIHEKGK